MGPDEVVLKLNPRNFTFCVMFIHLRRGSLATEGGHASRAAAQSYQIAMDLGSSGRTERDSPC
jgi:hypothetical protein